MQRRERPELILFAKGFSKHPHVLAIVDFFILYPVLVSASVIFHPFFAMNKRRYAYEAKNILQFFHSNVYMFKREQKWKTDYINMLSVLRNRLDIAYQCQHL